MYKDDIMSILLEDYQYINSQNFNMFVSEFKSIDAYSQVMYLVALFEFLISKRILTSNKLVNSHLNSVKDGIKYVIPTYDIEITQELKTKDFTIDSVSDYPFRHMFRELLPMSDGGRVKYFSELLNFISTKNILKSDDAKIPVKRLSEKLIDKLNAEPVTPTIYMSGYRGNVGFRGYTGR